MNDLKNTTELDNLIKYLKRLKEIAKIEDIKLIRPPQQQFNKTDGKLYFIIEDFITIKSKVPLSALLDEKNFTKWRFVNSRKIAFYKYK